MALPEEIAAKGAVMVPRLWAIETTGGVPNIPAQVTVNDGGTPVVVDVWDHWRALTVDGLPAREYRHTLFPDRLVVGVRAIGGLTIGGIPGAAAVVFVPARTREQAQNRFDLLEAAMAPLRRRWACVPQADGSWTVPALDADAGVVATTIKASWPAMWRQYQADDLTGAPTGARCIGAVLA